MKTITFYSYKGGVGRSLALVNIASRLVEFGKKVCVIDFDLEAPGLHMKFPPNNLSSINKDNKGIVDYIYEFTKSGIINRIKEYSLEISISPKSIPLILIPAGDTESPNYWKRLSSINWHYLMYENPNGLSFFLKLKENIFKEFSPDFLLIDSRTGISETSGISLSLLADDVVIVAANNKENLSGARRILKSIYNVENNVLGRRPNVKFVLSRIPFTDKPEDRHKEQVLVNKIKRGYLLPYISEINVIHSDRELEEVEKVKIAYEKDESNTQISIDYLRLFESLTKDYLSEGEVARFKSIRESERLISLAYSVESEIEKLSYLDKAIALNGSNIESYNFRGQVHLKLKNYEKAKDDIDTALLIDDRNKSSLFSEIEFLAAQKDYYNAEIKINAYLKLYPGDLNGLMNQIANYNNQHRFEEAEQVCSILIDEDPFLPLGYTCRGNVRRLMKKFDEALQDIYTAIEIESEEVQTIGTLAEIYAETGRIHDFYINLESAIKLNKEFMTEVISEEEVYKKFFTEERFQNLLFKYEIFFLNKEEEDL